MAGVPTQTFEAFGFKVPMPRWAVSVLAAVVILGVAGYLWVTIYQDPQKQVVSLKQVNEQLASDIDEYGRHVLEAPAVHQQFSYGDGTITVGVFTDHCVLIQQKTTTGMFTRIVQDMSRVRGVQKTTRTIPFLVAPVSAAGQCLNPHPGPFAWSYGAQRGEWVEVWRRWNDGCMHYQLFHPPSGSWATNQDGTPAIVWVSCLH